MDKVSGRRFFTLLVIRLKRELRCSQIVDVRVKPSACHPVFLKGYLSLHSDNAGNQLHLYHNFLLFATGCTKTQKKRPAPSYAESRITSSTGRVTLVTTPVWIYWTRFCAISSPARRTFWRMVVSGGLL